MAFTIGIEGYPFDSQLERPSGRDPQQNAWLTIRLKLKLKFVEPTDTHLTDLIVRRNGKSFAIDKDKKTFPIKSWTGDEKQRFHKAIQKREAFWNAQFYLETPNNFDDLNVVSFGGDGWLLRPNVMCLFRLEITDKDYHREIRIINIDSTGRFRSDSSTYDSNDQNITWEKIKCDYCGATATVKHDTIAHEIGHALYEDHIEGLRGNPKCSMWSINGDKDECYGKALWAKKNVMGHGDQITVENAKPWLDRIQEHTGIDKSRWRVSMGYIAPKRKALGAAIIDGQVFPGSSPKKIPDNLSAPYLPNSPFGDKKIP